MFVKNGDDPKAKILHILTSASDLDVPVDQAIEQYKKALNEVEEDELHKEGK